MIDKFVNHMAIGDMVITYNSQSREYIIGKITGEYVHHADVDDALANSRAVAWEGKAERDNLTPSS